MIMMILSFALSYQPLKPFNRDFVVQPLQPLIEYKPIISWDPIDFQHYENIKKKLNTNQQISLNEPRYFPLTVLTPSDYKRIQIDIFQSKQNWELAYALSMDWLQSIDNAEEKQHALFKLLFLAIQLGLISDAQHWATQLLPLSKDPEHFYLATQAYTALDSEYYHFLEKHEPKEIDWKKVAESYVLAKSHDYWYQKQIEKALQILNSSNYPSAKLLKSIWYYRLGQLNESKSTLLELTSKDEIKNPRYKMLAWLNLGRILFALGDFAEAIDAYNHIPQSEVEWILATIEKSWIQLSMGDYGKVVGNTHVLHSTLTRQMVIPETYFIQALGYFALCYWGNAIEASSQFSKSQQLLSDSVFQKILSVPPEDLFEKFLQITKNSSDPLYLWVKYLTLSPAFYHSLNAWTNLQNQHERINRYALKIATAEKKLLDTKRKLISKNLDTSDIDVKLYIWTKARSQIKVQRQRFLTYKAAMEKIIKVNFAKATIDNIEQLRQRLAYLADQNEILQIDIYNLANQTLRGRMIELGFDEKTKKMRLPSSNSLSWNFKGEIWNDELGHFEASLISQCANQTGGKQ